MNAGPTTEIFPGPRRTLFLRACLLDGADARDAWSHWLAGTDDAARSFADPREACVRLAPLLDGIANGSGTGRVGAAVSASVVREELRWGVIATATGEALAALRGDGIEPILVGGAATALETYASPWQRHCHDVDLVLPPEESQAAARALRSAGWTTGGRGSLRHSSGTHISLHTSILRSPGHRLSVADVRLRARSALLGGAHVTVAAEEHQLLRASEGAFAHAQGSLIWAADAAVLARSLDSEGWRRAVDVASSSGSASAVGACMRYLATEVGITIPEEAKSLPTDASEWAACLTLRPRRARRTRLHALSSLRARVRT